MTQLNGPPLPTKGVLLSSRRLTIDLPPTHYTLLNDLIKVSNMSIHETASDLLQQAIVIAHTDLKRQKFVWLISNWVTWGRG